MAIYLEARVGYESGVIAQVGGVVLNHPLCLWLTQVLIRRGEAPSRQHHCGGFWDTNTTRTESALRRSTGL